MIIINRWIGSDHAHAMQSIPSRFLSLSLSLSLSLKSSFAMAIAFAICSDDFLIAYFLSLLSSFLFFDGYVFATVWKTRVLTCIGVGNQDSRLSCLLACSLVCLLAYIPCVGIACWYRVLDLGVLCLRRRAMRERGGRKFRRKTQERRGEVVGPGFLSAVACSVMRGVKGGGDGGHVFGRRGRKKERKKERWSWDGRVVGVGSGDVFEGERGRGRGREVRGVGGGGCEALLL